MKALIVSLCSLCLVALEALAQRPLTIDGPNVPLSAVCNSPVAPSRAEKCPVAVLCHGFGSSKEDGLLRQVAVELERRGVATLLFDFAGSGASVGPKFTFADMTVATEAEDLVAVVEYANRLPFADGVVVVGHSMGGAVAILAASELGRRKVKALALLAPAVSLREDAVRGSILGARFNPADPPRELSLFGGSVTLGRDYISVAQETNFLSEAAKYKGPALIVYGSSDAVVPPTYGEYLEQVMPSAKLKVHRGFDHVMARPGDSDAQVEVAREVAQFVADAVL